MRIAGRSACYRRLAVEMPPSLRYSRQSPRVQHAACFPQQKHIVLHHDIPKLRRRLSFPFPKFKFRVTFLFCGVRQKKSHRQGTLDRLILCKKVKKKLVSAHRADIRILGASLCSQDDYDLLLSRRAIFQPRVNVFVMTSTSPEMMQHVICKRTCTSIYSCRRRGCDLWISAGKLREV